MAILGDEIAFWRNETSANPDTEILGAARPMLLTTGGPLICISSPYARRGELWNAFRRYYGPEGDPLILVAKAASRVVNPGLSEKKIQRAYELDPAKASAEYGAEFRTDIESFVSREAIEATTIPGRLELPPLAGVDYRGFVDPSGGAQDSMTIAIAHSEGNVAILDAVKEVKPPFSPDAVVEEFAALLAAYQLTEVVGDRWGGGFVVQQFEKRGVTLHDQRETQERHLQGTFAAHEQSARRVARPSAIVRPAWRPRTPHGARRKGLDRPRPWSP